MLTVLGFQGFELRGLGFRVEVWVVLFLFGAFLCEEDGGVLPRY